MDPCIIINSFNLCIHLMSDLQFEVWFDGRAISVQCVLGFKSSYCGVFRLFRCKKQLLFAIQMKFNQSTHHLWGICSVCQMDRRLFHNDTVGGLICLGCSARSTFSSKTQKKKPRLWFWVRKWLKFSSNIGEFQFDLFFRFRWLIYSLDLAAKMKFMRQVYILFNSTLCSIYRQCLAMGGERLYEFCRSNWSFSCTKLSSQITPNTGYRHSESNRPSTMIECVKQFIGTFG